MEENWKFLNVRGLEGRKFRLKRYTRWSETWDHDHCGACWAKFAEFDGPDIQNEGYASLGDAERKPDYNWICKECFLELKEAMGWVEVTINT